MDVDADESAAKTIITILITGANSGIGFCIACRLIDEFLATRPQSQTLHLLFSTRDAKKSADTLLRLNGHLQKTLRAADRRTPGVSRLLEPRIKLEGMLVDLTRLITVKALAKQLVARKQILDAVIWNAGIAGWTGANYLKGTLDILRDLIKAVTSPEFMYCDVGLKADRQLPPSNTSNTSSSLSSRDDKSEEPPLGKVFMANIFGHYMLTHWLAPVLSGESRIIWTSSTSALPKVFNIDDLQGFQSDMAYESSKRLTDLLVLTSELSSTKPYVNQFLPIAPAKQQPSRRRSRMYVTHPGVSATAIFDLPWFMYGFYIMALYLARWLGSPWHCIDPYKGAVSACFAALAPPPQLEGLELAEGKGKWGSATDIWGEERVARSEVSGWGYSGVVGERPSGGAWVVGNPPTTKESREEFEMVGREVWRELEALRLDWEKRLGAADVADSVDL